MRADLLLLVGAFAVGTLVATLLGAINTGTALTFGQLAFAAALVFVIARRPGDGHRREQLREEPPARAVKRAR